MNSFHESNLLVALSGPAPGTAGETNKKMPRLLAGHFWWGKMDSNHRRQSQQIYSLSPLATREFPHMKLWSWWTDSTPDLLITNQLLYQLSYTSSSNAARILSNILCFVNMKFTLF